MSGGCWNYMNDSAASEILGITSMSDMGWTAKDIMRITKW